MSPRDPETHAIIGAAMEVHRELGPGFLEAVYANAMLVELTSRSIPHQPEVEIPVLYKGNQLACTYRADLICFGRVLVELKAVLGLTRVEHAQMLNYLKIARFELGLLINFGRESLEFRRFIQSQSLRKSVQSAVTSCPSVETPKEMESDDCDIT